MRKKEDEQEKTAEVRNESGEKGRVTIRESAYDGDEMVEWSEEKRKEERMKGKERREDERTGQDRTGQARGLQRER
jgi:hypothetical protein